ncbi:hypothetical protein AGMMS50276_24810 [Synergistales bacterium]|nr:hypothetical protein AGMMS50276_24810 [Synergistales bacterium]
MKKLKWVATYFEEIISGVAFVIMVGITVCNVLSRYFWGYSFIFAEEVAYISFAYTVSFGVTILFKHNAMIAIEVLVNCLPRKAQKVVRIFDYALLLIVNLILLRIGVEFAIKAWVRPMTALRIPYTFIDSAPVIAFGLMAFYSARFLILILLGEEIQDVTLEDQH